MNIHNCHDSLNEKCINHKYIIKMGPKREITKATLKFNYQRNFMFPCN